MNENSKEAVDSAPETVDADDMYDVVQIGYGPVGQAHAALLGGRGHSVAVFERQPNLFNLSRAGHMDHEIMRILQSINCSGAIEREAVCPDNYDWLTSDWKPMMRFPWGNGISGWRTAYLFYQPVLDTALDARVQTLPNVEVTQGWEAVDVKQHPTYVEVVVQPKGSDGSRRRAVRGRYLVAADGGNSFVRRHLGVQMRDLGYEHGWLVLDFRLKRHVEFDFDNGQICDPRRPSSLFQMGYCDGEEYRRFSFAQLPDETREELTSDETVWDLVSHWIDQDDAELIRKAYYVLEAKVLDDLRRDRVLFVGDAGHVMPPFLGQGMCSGVRDVCNLAWKLDLVLAGKADEVLLNSYSKERQPHAERYAELSRDLAKILNMTDVDQARERDQAFLDGTAPELKPFPWIETGVLQERPPAEATPLIGRLGPQSVIEMHGRRGKADDILGSGWCLISREDPSAACDKASSDLLDLLGVRTMHLGAGGVVDVEGVYDAFLAEAGLAAVLVRPDFYVFGGVTDLGGVDALLAGLRDQLHLTPVLARSGSRT